ncbi:MULTISPECIES: hypothetical protein [Rhodobacterales]|uniref:hypothetical protein n=1 Tax=Yoonia sp. 1_MG-2023 TaxID=3062659 RepID=UPI0011BFD8DF|nr:MULTISPECIES: hypothetical protein [Rhodobacterales]MDO6591813.1 hypothetical protein [Yoonia sp. 1_MG-2023]
MENPLLKYNHKVGTARATKQVRFVGISAIYTTGADHIQHWGSSSMAFSSSRDLRRWVSELFMPPYLALNL